ncbi:MAG TPA: OmpA family protein [Polyangiaceae bacterium]|nr:OmpA family protein [Polyangiaceae bacterium]
MNRVGFASISLLGLLWAGEAKAQPAPPPPPPASPPPVAPAAAPAPAPAAAPAPAPASAPAATPAPAPGGSASASAQGNLDFGSGLEGDAALGLEGEGAAEPTDYEKNWRKASLQVQNAISGSTGLLHVIEAGSGAVGTFRFSLQGSYFTTSGFLCNAASTCPTFGTESPSAADEIDGMGAHLGLSATVLPFLEGFIGFHNRAVSNTRSRPQLLQVLGDTNLGVKGFMPKEPDAFFGFGGELELWLLNGTGGVGLDGGGTSFTVRGLSTIDLNNRIKPDANIPLRFHVNASYQLDNSGKIVEELETTPPPLGRGARVSRIERFGLDINRVDFIGIGLGAEFDHPIIRPFLEWSIDIPLNRQDYICNLDDVELAGEGCLGEHQGFSSSPSRLGLGARVFPWVDHGLSLMAAFDIGTGATSDFVEEVAPEAPWNLWFGLAYAVDTVPPPPVIQRVEKPAPPALPTAAARAYVTGTVTEKGTQTPIAGAVLRYDGRNLTGMVSADDGSFRSTDLEPGTYTLNVSAAGYRDGQCVATIPPPRAAPAPAAPAAPPPGTPGAPTTPTVSTPGGVAAAGGAGGSTVINVICELEGLPKVGNVVGAVSDGETAQPVVGARIIVTDPLNRQLELSADTGGGFSVGNVKPGTVKLSVEAPGYFTAATEVQVESRKEVQARIVLNKRPAKPNVVVQGREVKLKKEVHFQHDSTEILPDSMGLLEELAELFKSKPDIRLAEVQGHTDNTGSAVYNQRLSQGRAQAVVDALVRLGVTPDRLVAKGYGADKPLVPNSTDANRAKNRRVQVMIQQQ